jgi:Holliday junction resolvase RusA-like endonuclease
MIIVEWEGKAVGINQREGRTKAGRKYNKKEYIDFKNSLAWSLIAANRTVIKYGKGKVGVIIRIYGPYDWDNLLKPISDAIEQAGIVDNDKWIKRANITIEDREKKGIDKIRIAIYQMEEIEDE